ncbi:MAG TPA: hypothetical protein VFM80_06655 [Gracilimonas sp.]|uniref:hydrolase n=1 Tax=Gracilimonas sp. TaxID=1974203 RepID=UPI002D82E303|nr:hypothetical protein [Gracilimonas sp.]
MSLNQQDFLLSANKFDIPKSIEKSPGILLGEERIKSVLLSTDLSFIQNLSADAIMMVNPFDKSNEMDRVIIEFGRRPVICDIGGGLLREEQSIRLAAGAFKAGASAVVLTKPTPPEIVERIRAEIDGPLVYTVMLDAEDFEALFQAGVNIFNISTGEFTAETVATVKELVPESVIIANGGPHDSTIKATIEMGAQAIVFNPPTATEILRSIFDDYRNNNG